MKASSGDHISSGKDVVDTKDGSYLVSSTPQSVGQLSKLLQVSKDIVRDFETGIYAVGGHGLNTVEKYDPRNNTWSLVAPMSTVRYGNDEEHN